MDNLRIGQPVVGTYQGKEYPGTIEDKAGDEYAVRTSIWREKKWWHKDELTAADDYPNAEEQSRVLDSTHGIEHIREGRENAYYPWYWEEHALYDGEGEYVSRVLAIYPKKFEEKG